MVQNSYTPHDISDTDLGHQPKSKRQHREPSSHHHHPLTKGSLNSKGSNIINPVTASLKKYIFQFNLCKNSWIYWCLYSFTETSTAVHFKLELSPTDAMKNLPLMSVWPGGIGMYRNLINCGWLLYLLCLVRCLEGIFHCLASSQFHWGMLQF